MHGRVCTHCVSYAHTCMHTDMSIQTYANVHKCMHAAYTHAHRKHFTIDTRSYQLDIYVQVIATYTYFQLCLNHQFHNLTIESYIIQYIMVQIVGYSLVHT